MIYMCNKCKKEFFNKSSYTRHINRKTSCILIIEGDPTDPIKTNQCRFCYKLYSNKYILKTHLKICKIKNTEAGMDILNKMVKAKENEKINEMLKEIGNLKNVINTLVLEQKHIKPQDNITNNIQLNITINCYKTPNISNIITPKKLLSMFQKYGSKITGQMVNDIYFNSKYPENHSIYITNKKTDEVLIYEDDLWKTSTCQDTIPNISKTLYNYMDNTSLPGFDKLNSSQQHLINDIKSRNLFIEYEEDDYNIIRLTLINGRNIINKPYII